MPLLSGPSSKRVQFGGVSESLIASREDEEAETGEVPAKERQFRASCGSSHRVDFTDEPAFGHTQTCTQSCVLAEHEAMPHNNLRKYFVLLYFLHISLTFIYGKFRRGWEWYDSLYFSVVAVHTVGYGDLTLRADSPKECMIAAVYVLTAVTCVGVVVGNLLNEWLDRQEEKLKGSPGKRVREIIKLGASEAIAAIGIGTVGFAIIEDEDWSKSLYWAVSTASTVGFGDVTAKTIAGKLFTVIYIPLSIALFLGSIECFAEVPMEMRKQKILKTFIDPDPEIANQLFEELAHGCEVKRLKLCQHEGYITRNEFTLYLLRFLGKIDDGDLESVRDLFVILDQDGNDRLTREEMCKQMEQARTSNLWESSQPQEFQQAFLKRLGTMGKYNRRSTPSRTSDSSM